ncbi:MAG: hypothetical protein M3R55_03060 [Acidobacteriota bacterium]|nr:hypothetical protein [Acidobacteriota bacterium]
MDANNATALRNAWTSVLEASDELRATSLDQVDLEAIQPKVLAQANAAQALRGLVEELRRQVAEGR